MTKEKKLLELTSDVVFKSFMTSDNTLEYKALLLSEITGIPKEVFLKASYIAKELIPRHHQSKPFRTISENIERGENYKNIVKHIEINFNNFSVDDSIRLGIADLETIAKCTKKK